MARPKKANAARVANWSKAVGTIKNTAKRVVSIVTPRKKKRRRDENEPDITTNGVADDTIARRIPPDNDPFATLGIQSVLLRADTLTEAPEATGTPITSPRLRSFLSDWKPRSLARFSPLRTRKMELPIEDDDTVSVQESLWGDSVSILGQRFSKPPQTLGSTVLSDSDSEFVFFLADDEQDSHPFDLDTVCDEEELSTRPDRCPPANPSPIIPLLASNPHLRDGYLRQAPSITAALSALVDLDRVLRPPRKKGPGYLDPKLDPFTRSRIEGIRALLAMYTSELSNTRGKWRKSSTAAAVALCRGEYCARVLRRLSREYILDREVLPVNPFGEWNHTMLTNEDLVNDLIEYLQLLGSTKSVEGREDGISAAKVQAWFSLPEIQEKHGILWSISLATAKRYLNALGYRFGSPVQGQYVDGHERVDVVHDRNNIYIPQLSDLRKRMRVFDKNGQEITETMQARTDALSIIPGTRVVLWYHDESIFYAHDRRRQGWRHKDASVKPYKKGEGLSLMVADFFSADFGWLIGPETKHSARVILAPGKNRDGYFTNTDIVKQARDATEILPEFGPGFQHVFVYDNATTHKKRADDALSARRMPMSMPAMIKSGKNAGKMRPNFLVEQTVLSPDTNKPLHNSDGSLMKEKIQMTGATHNGAPQSLYVESGPNAGLFKGMKRILEERGFNVRAMAAQCTEFNCAMNESGTYDNCCMRRTLFNEPDFSRVRSVLEDACNSLGVQVIFLPKFHCELNPIEQCWGYAKRLYRLCEESSKEEDLRRNMLNALDSIPLICMRRFCNRSLRYADAYAKGMNGREAAYATKRYRGHRSIPVDYMKDFESSGALEAFKELRQL
ncbi:unnamed protein product [Mycena citricolor]|uniref:Tc1-like transposase DDE domain-containing protein n=1 Tax=Mycena citricolor TaxID=2018698 RepID=A0AAD2GV58_9AGAR|nr:unnamed protein product [Mycena citricolor]